MLNGVPAKACGDVAGQGRLRQGSSPPLMYVALPHLAPADHIRTNSRTALLLHCGFTYGAMLVEVVEGAASQCLSLVEKAHERRICEVVEFAL
jgi:hypothetical protein